MLRVNTRFRITCYLLCVWMGLCSLAQAQSTPSQAQEAYQRGDTAQAIQLYEQLLANNPTNGAIYYNLGRIYATSGDKARAQYYDLLASQFMPRDSDVQAALNAYNVTPLDAQSPLTFLATLTTAWLTLQELGYLTLAVWIILWVGLTLKPSRWRQAGLMGLLALFLSLSGLFGTRFYVETTHPRAVMLITATAYSGPDASYLAWSSIPTGTLLRLEQYSPTWSQVLTNDGQRGWLPNETLGIIRAN